MFPGFAPTRIPIFLLIAGQTISPLVITAEKVDSLFFIYFIAREFGSRATSTLLGNSRLVLEVFLPLRRDCFRPERELTAGPRC